MADLTNSRPIRAVIHPSALRHNLGVVRRAAGDAKVWAVVKANAYGHGIANVFEGLRGADGFACLDLTEAQTLRSLGWRGPILLLEGAFNARGTLSADGKKIALVHRPSGSNYKVALQDINTGITNILTPTSLDESPSFSPNGQMVVYATREGSRGLLSIMSTDGRFRMNLPSEQGEVREPAWAPK